MSILILAAQTGHGHVSVMNTLKETFEEQGYHDCICIPDFYESILPVNKILSDYYNFLLRSSISLCDKYVEFNSLTRPEKNEDIYQMTKEKYIELFKIEGLEAIISTATSINYNLMRSLKEEGFYGHIPFYIIVTDPYDPIAPGFDSLGATRYFCANEVVKSILMKSRIPKESIVVSGYPVSKRFAKPYKGVSRKEAMEHLDLDIESKVIILNSGSQGNMTNLEYLIQYLCSDIQESLVMLCGVNKALYKLAKLEVTKSKKKNVVILPFYNQMEELLGIADIYVTKAGANSFHEALFTKTAILIDAIDGLVYQERGIGPMLKKLGVGNIVDSINQFIPLLKEQLYGKEKGKIQENYRSLVLENGSDKIVSTVLSDLQTNIKIGI